MELLNHFPALMTDLVFTFNEGYMKKITSWLFMAVASFAFVSMAHAQNYNNAPEVVSTLYSINKAQIETAQIAKNKTINDSVLKFANKMINEHKNAQTKLDQIAKNNKINKISSADARTIRGEARKAMRAMKKVNGITFDQTYMDYVINSHKKALNVINDYILPRVHNAELKDYTLAMRQNVMNHLQEAQQIRMNIQ